MNVILTHDQADFDGIASLLGAHLLFNESLPILPPRCNRNVRAFINIFKSELPFVTTDEINSKLCDQITLVDTQSLISFKGLSIAVPVHVIDHHKLKSRFPSTWSKEIHRNGANTTYFVDKLRESGIFISPIHSTLLILGIYEDTGSFSYKNTTEKDLSMASFLIQCGADIQAVNRFLNPPLSKGQHELLNQLLEKAKTHEIHGQKVVITFSDARKTTDEISSIAHKIRDYLDPDGLFLIVNTKEGIRIIGRSTSDQIDVSKVLKSFGGGGHERAAAALIKSKSGDIDNSIQDLHSQILTQLESTIIVPVPIKKIMSKNPKVLAPNTKASEALALMTRYGYEGFPVVDQGKVVGLLSRKAVDRAITHKIDVAVKSLMEVGNFVIYETDDMLKLQTIMAESGWGQIPVLDPFTQEISGIVTRTDLLRTILKNKKSSTHASLKELLRERLEPTQFELLHLVAKKGTQLRTPTYVVGGFVRDLLLGFPSSDYDIVVESDAIFFTNQLVKEYGGKITSHSRFGTARWDLDSSCRVPFQFQKKNVKGLKNLNYSIDFISARSEYYTHPTALPKVEKGSIKLDMQRRDFTINTMAIRIDGDHFGELIDYFYGFDDLSKQLIRILHPLSFVDDPTRILRAFRFSIRFNFSIEARTKELITEGKNQLRSVSGARILHEMNLIIEESKAVSIFKELSEQGILEAIHPDLSWSDEIKARLEKYYGEGVMNFWQLPETLGEYSQKAYLSYLIWFSSLNLEKNMKIVKHLHLPGIFPTIIRSIAKVESEIDKIIKIPPSGVLKRLVNVHPVALFVSYIKSSDLKFQNSLIQYITNWSKVKLSISGDDLLKMGVKKGPEIKWILDQVRFNKVDGNILNLKDEKQFIHSLIEKLKT